ncbi:integral membrane protein [Daldinia childiae]|uniref:uncharacterized protein n=1 Tax=Daldinia childiae TaxID=326645 RepID=UPI0014466B41|nr:uncharacterized protein GL218_06312 [Daldinia childiae]KAF3057244.1 integral membrane protein [Daldinia childiae]
MDNTGSGNSGNLGPSLLAIAWVFTGISTLVVALRFYVRISILRRFRLDDCMIVITLLCVIGSSVLLTIAVSWGFGKHAGSLSEVEVRNSMKWVYACKFFAVMNPLFGRISFAFLLSELIPPSKLRRIFLWTPVGVHFMADFMTVVIVYTQCRPSRGYWDKTIKSYCRPPTVEQYSAYVQGSLGSVADLVLAVFPCTLFWNLSMHWKQKVFLSSIMGLGIFAMIACVVKTIELGALTHTDDLTYQMAKLAICWTLEAHIVLISASIPTVRAFFKTPKSPSNSQSDHSNEINTFMKRKRAMGGNSPPDGINGIRKEITVSTISDSDSQLAYTQHHTSEHGWGEI